MSKVVLLSNAILIELLKRAMPEERHALTQVLHTGATKPIGPEELQEEICVSAGNKVGNFIRGG